MNKADLALSFEKIATDMLIENVLKAANSLNIKNVVLAGGVSANSYIREKFKKLEEKDLKVYYPEPTLCTDNAAMIACAGYYNYLEGNISDLKLNAVANLKLNS